MSQKPITILSPKDLTEFFEQLFDNSGFDRRKIWLEEPQHIMVDAYPSTGEGRDDQINIHIWLERAYHRGINGIPDESRLILSKFSISHHVNSQAKPHILEGWDFLRKTGYQDAYQIGKVYRIFVDESDRYYNVRNEDSLFAFFEKYIRYANFYGALPLFSLTPRI